MKVTHKLIDGSNERLVLFVLTNGENELNDFSMIKASIVHCHIDSDGYNITQEELFSEKNVNHLMLEFTKIIKQYSIDFPEAKMIIVGSDKNAEVALDVLIKENEIIDGGILIKPILNIALTDGIMIHDHTKVLIVVGTLEEGINHIEEQEISEILSVNGYDVETIEINEDEDLSNLDVKVSINWIHENFYE